MAHHHYCLGGASTDEQLAAMMDTCEHATAVMANMLSQDTTIPPRRID